MESREGLSDSDGVYVMTLPPSWDHAVDFQDSKFNQDGRVRVVKSGKVSCSFLRCFLKQKS